MATWLGAERITCGGCGQRVREAYADSYATDAAVDAIAAVAAEQHADGCEHAHDVAFDGCGRTSSATSSVTRSELQRIERSTSHMPSGSAPCLRGRRQRDDF